VFCRPMELSWNARRRSQAFVTMPAGLFSDYPTPPKEWEGNGAETPLVASFCPIFGAPG
jgi:hypothetical protein